MFSAVCETYYIAPAEVLKNILTFQNFSLARIILIAVSALLSIAVVVLAGFISISSVRARDRAKAAACLVLFSAIRISVEFAQAMAGTGQVPNLARGFSAVDTVNADHFRDVRLARLPLRWLLIHELFDEQVRNGRDRPYSTIVKVPSASAVGMSSAGIVPGYKGQMPDLVLIVVESWGLSKESSIGDSIMAPYAHADLLSKYTVLKGTVPFFGATVVGEARELCGTTLGLHILGASKSELKECLPDRLTEMGYRSAALHGMDGHLFDRRTWYSTIGFGEEWFRNQFREKNLPNCAGAMLGTCDAAIANWIGNRLNVLEDHPRFIYWMTLNSHLPVLTPPSLQSPASCSISSSLAQHPALCSWFQLEVNVHDAIYKLAASPHARPTVFVVVGDHAPPYSDLELRNDFSSTVVPYVVLVPNNIAKPRGVEPSKTRRTAAGRDARPLHSQ